MQFQNTKWTSRPFLSLPETTVVERNALKCSNTGSKPMTAKGGGSDGTSHFLITRAGLSQLEQSEGYLVSFGSIKLKINLENYLDHCSSSNPSAIGRGHSPKASYYKLAVMHQHIAYKIKFESYFVPVKASTLLEFVN
jgi:hypothetical protein